MEDVLQLMIIVLLGTAMDSALDVIVDIKFLVEDALDLPIKDPQMMDVPNGTGTDKHVLDAHTDGL